MKSLKFVIALSYLMVVAEQRSATTQLLEVNDVLDVYDGQTKLAQFDLWPFPFIDHVSFPSFSNYLSYGSVDE